MDDDQAAPELAKPEHQTRQQEYQCERKETQPVTDLGEKQEQPVLNRGSRALIAHRWGLRARSSP